MVLCVVNPEAFWNHFIYGFEQGQRSKLITLVMVYMFSIPLGGYLYVCFFVPSITEVMFWQIFAHEAECAFLNVSCFKIGRPLGSYLIQCLQLEVV